MEGLSARLYMLVQDAVSGKLIPSDDARFADAVMEARNNSGPWGVIALIIEYWKKTNPASYKSYVIENKVTRETRAKPRTGASKSNSMRLLLDIPEIVLMMVRKIYAVDELEMDKDFFFEFGRRFPEFMVAEKI